MTLLQTVIDEASGDDVGVASLLRKVKILAARTNTVALALEGNRSALLDRLRDLGLAGDDLDELTDAMDHDGAEPGSPVNAWLGRIMLGAGAVTTAATGQLIADAIGAYYGIGL